MASTVYFAISYSLASEPLSWATEHELADEHAPWGQSWQPAPWLQRLRLQLARRLRRSAAAAAAVGRRGRRLGGRRRGGRRGATGGESNGSCVKIAAVARNWRLVNFLPFNIFASFLFSMWVN